MTEMNKDYKVKDINLAEFGRQEILLAQDEMPALMHLRKQYKDCLLYTSDAADD